MKAVADSFEQEYRSALLDHLQSPREETLVRAYELGRQAVAVGKTLLETVSAHQLACQAVLTSSNHVDQQSDQSSAAGDFLRETLSPFEMTHRGFRDAVKALRQMNEVLEEQIKRIAYSVHDEAGQLLVAVHLAIAEAASDMPERQRERLARVDAILNQVESQLRQLSHQLHPTELRDLGWLPVLRSLARRISMRAGIPVEVQTTLKERLPGTQEIVLYRVVQEALTNAAKHSRASRIRISVCRRDGCICCDIRDDGVGFDHDSAQHNPGLGLLAMRERLQGIGGVLSIDSSPGGGTNLSIRFPVEATHASSDSLGG